MKITMKNVKETLSKTKDFADLPDETKMLLDLVSDIYGQIQLSPIALVLVISLTLSDLEKEGNGFPLDGELLKKWNAAKENICKMRSSVSSVKEAIDKVASNEFAKEFRHKFDAIYSEG